MWTSDNRPKYNRDKLRYPSDLTDEEWSHIEPLIPPAKRGGRKRSVELREIVNGLMYVLSTGCQWRYVPKDLPPKSTLFDYFDLWNWDGTRARRLASSTARVLRARKKGVQHRSERLRCGQKDQGQEAPYPRRYVRPAAACGGSSRRHSRS